MSVRKALVIGIDDYLEQPLQNCVRDAEEMAATLSMTEYGFEVRKLLDWDATRRAIRRELIALFSGESDFVIFYFAGHGIADALDVYLAPIDTEADDLGIEIEYLRRLVSNRLPAGATALILLDCCHAGAATARPRFSPGAWEVTASDLDRTLYSLGTGKVLIAACQAFEQSYDTPDRQHGIFTHHLLQGLLGEAADSEGKIVVTNLYDYVSRAFEGIAMQTPVLKGDISGRIVLGAGLAARQRSELPEAQLRKIEGMAQQLMNDYIRSSTADIELWERSKYREACQLLPRILRWLDSQHKQFPQLDDRSAFKAAFGTAQNKLADLGALVIGRNTPVGVVKAHLGAGTFGTVWQVLAEDGRELAFKVYHPMDLSKREKRDRFKRGYDAMTMLDHPHIVKVHGYTECPLGFTMDFIPGGNARDFVSWSHDAEEKVALLLTVGETLRHAHARGVKHRDVKPENIIMRPQPDSNLWQPFLTDFDLAWFDTATQFTREGLGSLLYAAPEQLAQPGSNAAHAVTTDVYAFGQLCYFVLTKRDPVPLLSNNSYALREDVSSWGASEPAYKMVELYELCTRTKPGERIQDFREICDRLFEILQLLRAVDHQRVISFNEFATELAFSIVGATQERTEVGSAFFSPSRQTYIAVGAEGESGTTATVMFRVEAQAAPLLNRSSYDESRKLLNRQIDEALSTYRQRVYRQPGSRGPFETFIYVKDVPMNIDGVELCRPIILKVVDSIEQAG